MPQNTHQRPRRPMVQTGFQHFIDQISVFIPLSTIFRWFGEISKLDSSAAVKHLAACLRLGNDAAGRHAAGEPDIATNG